jgi:hypothetical protein
MMASMPLGAVHPICRIGASARIEFECIRRRGSSSRRRRIKRLLFWDTFH